MKSEVTKAHIELFEAKGLIPKRTLYCLSFSYVLSIIFRSLSLIEKNT